MGSSMTPSHSTLSDLESHIEDLLDFEALYLSFFFYKRATLGHALLELLPADETNYNIALWIMAM